MLYGIYLGAYQNLYYFDLRIMGSLEVFDLDQISNADCIANHNNFEVS